MHNSRSISGSSDRPRLGFSEVDGCRDKVPALPGMGGRAEKSAVMARRVWVCSPLLATLFFVMPAAAQSPGAELEEVSKPTASEPQDVPEPGITSLIFAAGLLTLLRRRSGGRHSSSRHGARNVGIFALLALLSQSIPAGAEAILIDDFSSFSELAVSGLPTGPKTNFEAFEALEALGLERDVFLERTSTNRGRVDYDTSGSLDGALSYASAASTTGNLSVTYDGADASPTLNPLGLNHLDLEDGGLNTGFEFVATSDLGAFVTLSVYTDATRYSSVTFQILADPTFQLTSYYVNFASSDRLSVASFVSQGSAGGADFSDVGAINFFVSGATEGVDVSISSFSVAIPEPDLASLIGGAGLLVLLRRRR